MFLFHSLSWDATPWGPDYGNVVMKESWKGNKPCTLQDSNLQPSDLWAGTLTAEPPPLPIIRFQDIFVIGLKASQPHKLGQTPFNFVEKKLKDILIISSLKDEGTRGILKMRFFWRDQWKRRKREGADLENSRSTIELLCPLWFKLYCLDTLYLKPTRVLHNCRVVREVDQATGSTYLLEADRATGSTNLWAYISCVHHVSLSLYRPVIRRWINSLTLLSAYFFTLQQSSGGAWFDTVHLPPSSLDR